MNTDLFGTALSCSSSLWYPDFLDYLKEHPFKAAHPKLCTECGRPRRNDCDEFNSRPNSKYDSIKRFYEPKFQAGDFQFTLEREIMEIISQDVPGVLLNG